MSQRRYIILILLFAIILSVFTTRSILVRHKTSQEMNISRLAMYAPAMVKTFSLSFSGVISDYLTLKTMTFIGEKSLQEQQLTDMQWKHVYQTLRVITALDPNFWDPYVLAEMQLVWVGKKIAWGNSLLLNAAETRVNDYRPYYFLWFNYYFFLKDTEKSSHYLKLAARRPNVPSYLIALASRLDLDNGHTIAGIIFLQGVLKETADPGTREYLKKRLDALKRIAFLEEKVMEYRKQFQNQPTSLEDLISGKIITEIPADPYGGKFYLNDIGGISTTSNLLQRKK